MGSLSIESGIVGLREPIQVRADIVPGLQTPPPCSVWQSFATMHEAPKASETAGTPSAGWCDADLKRAIAAAREAGLRSYRVEITSDGTIAIIVGDPGDSGAPGAHMIDGGTSRV